MLKSPISLNLLTHFIISGCGRDKALKKDYISDDIWRIYTKMLPAHASNIISNENRPLWN